MLAVHAVLPRDRSQIEQIAHIQGLLTIAATKANALSSQSVGVSIPHVEESVRVMLEILEDTFSVKLLS